MNNSTASFTADNIGLQVGQNPGQINSQFYYNYYNQSDDSKVSEIITTTAYLVEFFILGYGMTYTLTL